MKKMNYVVVATQNQHKLKEINKILRDFPIELKGLNDIGLGDLEVVEDGLTFEENSMKKAVEVMKASGHIAVADDSGLEVEILDNQPGVFSARFSGRNATDKKNNEKLLQLLGDIPMQDRKARFVSVISVAFPDGRRFHVRGEIRGFIGFKECGDNGFGYDPLFIVPQYNKSFGEICDDIKNKISHRAVALEKMKEELIKYL